MQTMTENTKPTLRAKATRTLFASAAYAWMLKRSKTCLIKPVQPVFVGDPDRGRSVQFSDLIETIQSHRDPGTMHSLRTDQFLWLADLQASHLETAARIARDITEEWIAHHGQWKADIWRLDIVAERLCNWMTAADFLLEGANPRFVASFSEAIAQQANHIIVAIHLEKQPPYGFSMQKALIYIGVSLAGHDYALKHGLKLLQEATSREILADGGHFLRNPHAHMKALKTLIEIREALDGSRTGPPVWLQGFIDQMTPVLRTFLLGDGKLVAFNGAQLAEPKEIEAILNTSNIRARAVTNAPHSGFQRISARRTTVVMDTGVADQDANPAKESAGTFSFEMSVGKQRVIVNCGTPDYDNRALSTALRGTPAHSTLCIGHTNSSEINKDGGPGLRLARRVHEVRREVDKNALVEATHDGYFSTYGLSHKRALYLSADGDELRGEDSVIGDGAEDVIIRFHLHPLVQASLVEAGDSILLKFGKTSGWRFKTSHSEIHLAQSVHFDNTIRRQCQQIELRLHHPGDTSIIKWRFSKEN